MAACKPEDHLTKEERKEIARQVWRARCEHALNKSAMGIKHDLIEEHREFIEGQLKAEIDNLDPKEVMDYFRSQLKIAIDSIDPKEVIDYFKKLI